MGDMTTGDDLDTEEVSRGRRSAGRAHKEKESDSKGRAKKVAQPDTAALPEAHESLLDLFKAVDHAYCFLVKNSIPPRVASLQSMVWRLFPGRFGDEASFLPRLRRLADIARAVLVLEEPPTVEVKDVLEIVESGRDEAHRLELQYTQKSTAGVGKAKVAKRQQLVRDALLKHAKGERTKSGRTGGDGSSGARTDKSCNKSTATRGKQGLSSSTRSSSEVGDRVGRGGVIRRARQQKREGKPSSLNRGNSEDGDKQTPSSDAGAAPSGEARSATSSGRVERSKTAAVDGDGGNHGGAGATGRRPPATGTPLSLSDPLSDSPAYVVCNRRGPVASEGWEEGYVHLAQGLVSEGTGVGRGKEDAQAVGESIQNTSQGRLRFDPARAFEHLKSLPLYEGQAVYSETLPGRAGEFADTARPLHPEVKAALASSKGVTRLFKHQALAIDAAMSGRHVSLSTATSSGKSVVFNVSVLEAIVGARPEAVALYLFPTKALAQDQLRSLRGLVAASPYLTQRVRPMTLDGDTPFADRGIVMKEANIVLTNPDMLHASVLPSHKKFRRMLANLSHVVIDEAHVYRGAFGAHVSMVLRRLLRLWAVNANPGPPPQFICCSATMRAAPEHFASLLPLDDCLGGRRMLYFGSEDTAPAGRKTVVLWRPPIVAEWFTPRDEKSAVAAATEEAENNASKERFRRRKKRNGSVSPPVCDSHEEDVVRAEKGIATTRRRQRGKNMPEVEEEATVAAALGASRRRAAGVDGGACLGMSLHALEGWQQGPTDNFYNKEYMKLMGAELPRLSSGRAVSPSNSSAPTGGVADGDTAIAQGEHNPHQQQKQQVERVAGERSSQDKTAEQQTPERETANAGTSHPLRQSCSIGTSKQTPISQETVARNGNGSSRGGGRKGRASSEAARRTSSSSSSAVAGSPEGGMEEFAEAAAVSAAAAEGVPGIAAAGCKRGAGQEEDDGAEGAGWEDGRRRSPIVETAQILAALVKQRVKTLAFCRTRKLTELTLRYGHQDLEKTAPQLVSLVQGYRGGYTKGERRSIEGRLFANELLGVTATCALELGVDIGELDVTLHLGFPGSVSSLRQQSGRAGRGGTDSLAIMILFQDPISQFFVRNPAELLHKEPEAAVLDANNELVLRAHLLCAAAECPLGVPASGGITDAGLFGGEERLCEVIDTLTGGDFPRLVRATGDLGWKANPGLDPPPCRRVGLRMIDPVSFTIVDDLKGGEAYDSVEYSRAFFTVFEGAIYLHQARQYLVTKLDLSRHVAHTRPTKVNYHTQARNNVDVHVTKRLEVSEDNHAHTGCVDVVCTVYGYVKKQMGTGRTIERGECSLPPLQYATRAFWLDVGATAKRAVENAGRDFEGGVHAVGHAFLAVVPLFLLCDASDVDCEHARPNFSRPQPKRILVFDKRPGGVGVSDAMFGCHRAVMSKAVELVEGCPCPEGCLACIHDHGCTGYNAIIDKQAALIILKRLIQDMMETEQQQSSVASKPSGTSEQGLLETPPPTRRRRRQCDVDQSDEAKSDTEDGGGFFLGEGCVHGPSDAAEPGRAGASSSDSGDLGGEDDAQRENTRLDMASTDARGRDGGTVTGVVEEGGDSLMASPRKKQRLRNLRVAKVMESARERDKAVVGCWIPSVP